ncbi:MAG: hypothetical protein ACE5IY_21930 [bacterium]
MPDFLAGTTATLLAPFVALPFEAVLDGAHPSEDEFIPPVQVI